MTLLGVRDSQGDGVVLEEEDDLHPFSEPLPGDGDQAVSPRPPAPNPRRGARPRALARFLTADHRYVLLGTSLWCCLCLGLAGPQVLASPLSMALAALPLAWLALSAVALVMKLVWWARYAERSPLCRPAARRVLRVASYLTWASGAALLVLGPGVALAEAVSVALGAESNPEGFLASEIYMVVESRQVFATGILTTVELALFGTVIAFFLALGLVFLRLQEPERSDNDAQRLARVLGQYFARLYSTVVRGTPMMVQGLLLYFAGFALFRAAGLDVTQTNAVWSFFAAGLVTISLNSTAYMMEVLRGGIEAVDPGQMEAARSLGLSRWQAMRKVIFPQGIKNAIPALSNELVINIKDSSVLSVIGVFDLMYATTTVAGIYYRQMEVYLVAALIYLALTIVFSRVLDLIARRLGAPARVPLGSSN